MGQPEGQFPPPGPAAPSTARIYNYLIGGDIHYPADRAAAGRILADFPEFAQLARANRGFVTRAVHYVATQGVIQFIDLGTGLPVSPAVHETAWRTSPAPGLPMWTTIPWSWSMPGRRPRAIPASPWCRVTCDSRTGSWPTLSCGGSSTPARRCAWCWPRCCTFSRRRRPTPRSRDSGRR